MADHYNHGMEEVLAKRLFRQVAEALNFLHSKRCVYLDIKPENVLLIKDKDKQLVAKLGDFGDVMHSRATKKSSALTVTSERRHIRCLKYEKPIINSYTIQWLPIILE